MSFNRLNYDTCSYKQVLGESIGPGEYQLGKPDVSCKPCFNKDPRYRLQRNGASLQSSMSMVDTDSELLNITRDASNCSAKKFNPTFTQNGEIKNQNSELLNLVECPDLTSEDTRLSNPPCTLRGTGWNRWEWLCQDPQERVLPEFDYLVDTRNVVRDNHRPHIPTPVDQTLAHPMPTNEPIMNNIMRVPSVPTNPPSVHWQDADVVKRY